MKPDDRDDFAERLARPTPTPGGGAAAARTGLYATALLRMVTSITLSKAGAEASIDEVREIERHAGALGETFRRLEEADVRAFESYLAALRLPKATEEEGTARAAALDRAARDATEVPLETMESALETLALARRLAATASRVRLRAESDIGASAELANAALRAAELNVRVNLHALGAAADPFHRRLEDLLKRAEAAHASLRREIIAWLEGGPPPGPRPAE